MDKDILVMSHRELRRLELIKKAITKELKQVELGELLGISYRQVKRLVKRVREFGVQGVMHALRGRANCRKIKDEVKEKILSIYARRYKNFGATLACEKLAKHEGIVLSRETLRKWLRQEGYQVSRRQRRKHRRYRERRMHCGEMVQMDGSHHDWLQGRGPKLVLMGYIDDATSQAFGRFYEYEGTIPALDSFKRYCKKYGVPQSVYLDKHTTYKSNRQEQYNFYALGRGDGLSDFERALKRLDVRVIHANSPQAKGRIERLFRTLQDRLVKELELAKAKTMEEANEVLEAYLVEHNQSYRRKAAKSANLHRSIKGVSLDEALCIAKERSLRNDFTVAHNGRFYQVLDHTIALKVEVREYVNGRMVIMGPNDKKLRFRQIIKVPQPTPKPRWTLRGPVSRKQRIKQLLGTF